MGNWFVSDKGDYLATNLMSAVSSGNIDLVKYYVEERHENVREYRIESQKIFPWTPLARAAEIKNYEIMTYLIEKGATPSDWALFLAVSEGNLQLLQYLFIKGAKFNCVFNREAYHFDDYCLYPECKNTTLIQWYFRYGNKKIEEEKQVELIKYLIDRGVSYSSDDLDFATKNGMPHLAQILLSSRPFPSIPTFDLITHVKRCGYYGR